ncbi:MAG: aldehyde dehydrogenase family protein [Actinomycetota bacterium]
MQQIPARVAGRPVTGDQWLQVTNPYDGTEVGRVPACRAGDVAAAVTAAAVALRRGLPQHERAEILDRAAALLAGRAEEFARTIVLEAGKPIRDARAEVTRGADTLRFSAAAARALAGEMVPLEASAAGAGRIGFTLRVPVGVVAAITPFNFPLNLVAHKLGPAVAAGCPVVLKPAEQTPISGIRLVDLLVEAGLPGDWVSVLTGTGEDVGAALVAHPGVRLVSFTGSVPVGRAIERAAAGAAGGRRVALELGGNAPVIVEPDADLARVTRALRTAGFSYAGQSCISTQRVLVHASHHGELVEALREAVATLAVGNPMDEATDVGPLISAQETERVRSWIEAAAEGGGKVVAGGDVDGPVLRPTVVDAPPLDCDLYRREVFGPVITVTPYADFPEAVALANDSDFGLQAGVFTADLGTALQAVRELDYGGVLVNEVPTWRADQQPYGGLRDSGNTREGPAYAVEEMTEQRFVMLHA